MNALLAPRVKETSTTTGTGTLDLLGAVSGFQTFVSGFGTGNQCYYTIVHGTAWEVGQGTVTDAATDTLSRDTVLASSAGGAKLSLGAGTKTVFCDMTRESVVNLGGHLFGCQLATNGADATNDIDFTAGQAASDDATEALRILLSPAAMTKRLDTVWAAGTGGGGRLSTDAWVNGTWHAYAFKPGASPDDFFFSTSTSPTPPAGTKKRRIGSILRVASANIAFAQDGDYFRLKAASSNVNTTNPGTSAVTATLTSVPTGVRMQAMMNASLKSVTSSFLYISDLDANDEVPSATVAPLATTMGDSATNQQQVPTQVLILTNTSAQVRYRVSFSDGSTIVRIAALGWWDRRGRDA